MLANHGEGFAVEGKVAGLGLEDAAVPLLQILPRKTMPFFCRGGFGSTLRSLLSPWVTG